MTRATVLDRHLAAMDPRTRTHQPEPASHFPANHPDLGSPGHRVGDRRTADDGKEYLVALVGTAAEIRQRREREKEKGEQRGGKKKE